MGPGGVDGEDRVGGWVGRGVPRLHTRSPRPCSPASWRLLPEQAGSPVSQVGGLRRTSRAWPGRGIATLQGSGLRFVTPLNFSEAPASGFRPRRPRPTARVEVSGRLRGAKNPGP